MRYTNGTDILTFGQIRALFPNTAFPSSGPRVDWLASQELHVLVETPPPSITASQVAYEDGVELVGDEWRLKWSVRNMDAQELVDRDATITQGLKERRDAMWSAATVTLSNGAVLGVDERTRRDTNDVFNAMNNANIAEYEGWNAVNGIYTMGIAHFQEYSVLALGKVAEAFTAYNATIARHGSEPFANTQEAVAYFDNQYGG